MAQICKNLNVLYVDNYAQDNPGLISLINAQRNLKEITLEFCNTEKRFSEELSKALTRKGCTINNITLYNSVGVISHSFLTSLVNLKKLSFDNSFISYEEIEEFKKYLSNSIFPELQSFNIRDDLLYLRELATLIEKTKGNILEVAVDTFDESADSTEMLLKAISNHCPKIECLIIQLGPKRFDLCKIIINEL